MSILPKLFVAHPIAQFKQHKNFYARYDGGYFLAIAGFCAFFLATGQQALFSGPALWWLAMVPIVIVGLIWSHLVIHNCTHGNLPKSINRLVGEILGLLVITRYASWDIVHMRHHRYSDDRVNDPHPNFAGYFKTVLNTITNVEAQLFAQYFETWGDCAEHRASERKRAWVSYLTNIVLIVAWTILLGPWFALCVFFPANAVAGLFVIHFNWSTHNGEIGNDFRPVNLNRGYYWLGNKLFAGIYMHSNHHKRPHLFNPMNWKPEFGEQDPQPLNYGTASLTQTPPT